jgi:hypothetical protein
MSFLTARAFQKMVLPSRHFEAEAAIELVTWIRVRNHRSLLVTSEKEIGGFSTFRDGLRTR